MPPAAKMLPSRMITVPASIGALPSPIMILPPVIAMVSALAGVAYAHSAQNVKNSRFISHPLNQVVPIQNHSPVCALDRLNHKAMLRQSRPWRDANTR